MKTSNVIPDRDSSVAIFGHQSPSTSLPPGFNFRPTSREIFSYYLNIKNDHSFSLHPPNPLFNLIPEVDIHCVNPFNLSESSYFHSGKGRWYFYVQRGLKRRLKCRVQGGVWKRRGKVRVITSGEDTRVLGNVDRFVFYSMQSDLSCRRKTGWILNEYRLVDEPCSSTSGKQFSLCCVYFKTSIAKKILDHIDKDGDRDSPKRQPNQKLLVTGTSELLTHEEMDFESSYEITRILTAMIDISNDPIFPSICVESPKTNISISKQKQLRKLSDRSANVGVQEATIDKPIDVLDLEGDFLELNDLLS